MTTRTRTMPETEQLRLAKSVIDGKGIFAKLAWRSELFVTIPGMGQVPGDLVYSYATPESEMFGVVEAHSLSDKLLDQLERWHGFVNEMWAVYPQKKLEKPKHHWLIKQLQSLGAGRIVLVGEVATIESYPITHPSVDTRLISAAFHSHDGSCDAQSGIAAAHRMNGDRDLLCRIADYTAKAVGDAGMFFTELPHDLKCAAKTPARLRKLIDSNRDWNKLPLDYSGTGRTLFYATRSSK